MGLIRHPASRLALLAAFCFLLGFSYNYHLPRIESWLLVEVEALSETHSPIRIWAQNLRFHLLPLGIVLEEVRLLPKTPVNRYMAPARLKEVGARLAFLPLLRGEIRLSSVFVRDSEINLFLRPDLFESKGPSNGSAMPKFDFEMLYRLPIDEIVLERVSVQGRLEPKNVVFRINDLDLTVENRYRSLYVDLRAPVVHVKPSGPLKPLSAQLDVRALVESREMQISALKLKADESFVVASGRFNGDMAAGRIENGAFDARAKIVLPDVNRWEQALILKPAVPEMKGRLEIDLGMELRRGKGHRLETQLAADGLAVGKYKVGSIQGHLSSDMRQVTGDKLVFKNDAGTVRVENLKADLGAAPPSISANVKIEKIEVRQLLQNLNVNRVPIFIPAKGDLACQGVIGAKPEVSCKGGLSVERVWVHDDKPEKGTIVDVRDAHITGSAKVTAKDVAYQGELQVGKGSKGRSTGVIDFEKGFKIAYDSDGFTFADVQNLANLKLEGAAKVQGTTEGTADWATLAMNVEGKDLWLEDYPLGSATTRLGYKKGHLTFDDVKGQFGSTQYAGSVNLDVEKERVQVLGTVPFADLHDLQLFFARKVTLPFSVTGTGQGQVEASGPLRFKDLSYKLRSKFFRGEIARETFDELIFSVTSVDGNVHSDQIVLTKATGIAEVKGQISPNGAIDVVAVSRAMRLEQSENIRRFGLDVQGLADSTVLIRGSLPRPRIELNGRLSRVVLADHPADDSVFKLNFLSDRLEGSGQFFGTTILGDWTYPFTDQAPFHLRLKMQKWDFSSLFSLFSRSARQLDFSTAVTASVNLNAPQGGFWNANGQVEVSEFALRKGSKSLASARPMYLTFRNGEINSSGFGVSSGDSYLKLDMVNLKRDRLNASLNGKLDMSLLGVFTPFISDLRGNMSLSTELTGSVDEPSFSGSAYIEKAYAKFVDFVHPFSNVRADILFNDNQVLINSLRAELGGGRIQGDGRITFAGDKHPVESRATFSDVKMNVPAGFLTSGGGTVAIHGDNFPYTMAIDYLVNGGEIQSDLDEAAQNASTLKASPYLPKFLSEDVFHPFTFDLNVKLKNPVLVNNSLAKTQVAGQVSAKGNPDNLLLTGTLTPLAGGKFFFHDTEFEITSSYIEYLSNPPPNPKIYLAATARVSETVQDENQRTTERQYDVNLLAQGRGPVPQIVLTSQPPLSQREIVSLLTFGVTASSLDERRSSESQAANTSTALGAAILKKAGGKRLRESLGVDVKWSSSQPTPETAASPKVTFSKQFTPNLGASASSTLQANPANSVRLEYRMNKSMSVIGSWEGGRENVRDQTAPTSDILGLDLEYKKQFK